VLDGLWLAEHGVGGVLLLAISYALSWACGLLLAGGTGPFDSFLLVPLLFVAVAALLVRPLLNAFALLVRALLGGADAALAARVEQLTRSRAASVDASATELRRIERDLHDGAQARLAAVGMTLGLAATFVRADPERAEALLAEARADAGKALSELRDLVRGIHPPVLADRGLAGGLEAAALLCPIPVDVDIELAGRAQAPVESAMYFAATEAIANIGKHAQAEQAWIMVRHADGMLRVTVADDGVGGVDAARGTGVRGIERRLAAFDGRLTVASPPGGPTELTMELPCLLIPNPPASGSSSPRTTSSSATA
jgi:signal transduction histidine kinase